jgi:hypothetical protein
MLHDINHSGMVIIAAALSTVVAAAAIVLVVRVLRDPHYLQYLRL